MAFGTSGPFAKALIDAGWSSAGAVLVRIGGAAVVLLVLLAVRRPGVLAALRADGPGLLCYGLLAVAGVQLAYFNAVRYMPVTVALLLEYLGPVIVIAWVWLVRRQRPSWQTLVGGGIAIVGLLLVVQIWSGGSISPAGIAWGLAAAVCQASFFLFADRAQVQTPPLVLAGVGMAVGAVLVAAAGLIGILPVVITIPPTAAALPTDGVLPVLLSTEGVLLAGVEVGWLATAGLLVVVSTVVAYLTGIAAINRIGATRGALVALLEVIAAGVASWLLLGEIPGAIQLVGGALILAGVALARAASAPDSPRRADTAKGRPAS